MTLCIQDEVCNRQLVPFVQSCSAPQCEDRLCRLAARRFYSNLPENVAEMLVFCQCVMGDQDCQHFQTMLNSNSCKQDHIAQWNCLEMLDNCTGEKICRFDLLTFTVRPYILPHCAGLCALLSIQLICFLDSVYGQGRQWCLLMPTDFYINNLKPTQMDVKSYW